MMRDIAVAVVREQLEDREIANYRALAEPYQVRLVTSTQQGPYDASGLGMDVVRCRRKAEPILRSRVLRTAARRFERDDWDDLDDLEAACGDARIVCVNETHIASSAQAARRRRDDPTFRLVTVCYENIAFRYEDEPKLAARKDLVRAHTDAFVALTPEIVETLATEGVPRDRIHLLTYGVDPTRFSPGLRRDALRSAWGARDDDVVVVFVGRLLREKGLVELLRAVAATGIPRLRTVFVGSGPEEPRLRRAAATLGIGDRVSFHGWVAATDVPAVLASADVFAMPSLPTPYWEEQLGFSMIEAMATGLPVVAVDSGGLSFVLGGGGLTVPPYRHEALTEAIGSLASDERMRSRLGRVGRNRVEVELNTDRAAAALSKVFDQVLPVR